ncbi:MAG TPA: hypothetical protein VGE12_08535 [Noviherbaspirillum sp.]
MASISIKDLPASIDLDRQAMRAIAGGTTVCKTPAAPAPLPVPYPNTSIVDYAGGATVFHGTGLFGSVNAR